MNNTPAFPPMHDPDTHPSGMTLRQYAAIHICAGLCTDLNPITKSLVLGAVEVADALLAELERTDTK